MQVFLEIFLIFLLDGIRPDWNKFYPVVTFRSRIFKRGSLEPDATRRSKALWARAWNALRWGSWCELEHGANDSVSRGKCRYSFLRR